MPRTLRIGDTGPAVKAAKRSVFKCLGTLSKHPSPSSVFGPYFATTVKAAQKKLKVPQTGVVGSMTWEALDDAGYIDAYSRYLLAKDAAQRPSLVFPYPPGANVVLCQDLHPTAGLYGNWALDWCGQPGTPVQAVERAKITKLSGRNPALGADQLIGIFGWSIHYESVHPNGYRYFSTHYGEREPLFVGQIVEAGQKIGEIGAWPGNPGRSHTHLGVTSPSGERDARNRMRAIANAPRVPLT